MPVSRRTPDQAWVITGPTSGIGRYAALELAQHGTVVLVGRDPRKLADLEREINARPNGHAVPVVGDFSDIPSARRAAAEVAALNLPLAGVANNAGLMGLRMSARTPRTGTWSSSPTTSGRSRSPKRCCPTCPTAHRWCSPAQVLRIRSVNPPPPEISVEGATSQPSPARAADWLGQCCGAQVTRR